MPDDDVPEVPALPALPEALERGVATAVDDEAPAVARVRAFKALEHTKEPWRRAVAERLVVVLGHAPDLAARAHVALLVLAPELRLLRDEDGAFVVVDRGLGLDELHRLFGPADDLPAFLLPPDKPRPAPYRSPHIAREQELERIVAARAAEHQALIARMHELGLDEDDLDDDDQPPGASRRRLQPLKEGTWVASFDVDDDRDLWIASGSDRLSLGRIRAGAWWSETTVGDHRGARRLRLALAHDKGEALTTRRERVIEIRHGALRIQLGKAPIDVDAVGRGAVVWVDEDAGDVVGITLSWSSWVAVKVPKPGEPETAGAVSKGPRVKPKPRL